MPDDSTEVLSGVFPVASVTGFGDPLTGGFGKTADIDPSQWEFAYLVARESDLVAPGLPYNFRISGLGQGTNFEGVITPEPATLGLLAVGALAGVLRRRRDV